MQSTRAEFSVLKLGQLEVRSTKMFRGLELRFAGLCLTLNETQVNRMLDRIWDATSLLASSGSLANLYLDLCLSPDSDLRVGIGAQSCSHGSCGYSLILLDPSLPADEHLECLFINSEGWEEFQTDLRRLMREGYGA